MTYNEVREAIKREVLDASDYDLDDAAAAAWAMIEARDKRIADLEAALKEARNAISSLAEDDLGISEVHGHPIRDELLHAIDAVLGTSNGG